MRVSVVIPTFNSGPWVGEAVSSVLAQTRPVDEIIVVDDGSTDDTPDRMAVFGPPVRYIRKDNGGVSSARNRGVAESTGDLVAFLDADDVWHPEKLRLQIAALGRRPDVGLLGTRLYPWPGVVPEVPPNWVEDIEDIRLDVLIVGYGWGASSMVIRTEVLQAAGPFDETLHGPEDRDMWIRVARLAPVAKLHLPLAGYRAGTPGSLSKNAVRMELGERAILRKLEAAGMFRGKWLLRRKAWCLFRYKFGLEHHWAGNRWTAIRNLVLSLLGYPLPYKRVHIRYPFGRIRSLALAILKKKHPSANSS